MPDEAKERWVYLGMFPNLVIMLYPDLVGFYQELPLDVGKRYEYPRYFRPDRNPVIIEVVRRERVSVAGKKWRALVVRPKIPPARGIFAEKSETLIWLSDDAQRLVLAIQSKFSFGQVTLKLKDYVVPGVAQP